MNIPLLVFEMAPHIVRSPDTATDVGSIVATTTETTTTPSRRFATVRRLYRIVSASIICDPLQGQHSQLCRLHSKFVNTSPSQECLAEASAPKIVQTIADLETILGPVHDWVAPHRPGAITAGTAAFLATLLSDPDKMTVVLSGAAIVDWAITTRRNRYTGMSSQQLQNISPFLLTAASLQMAQLAGIDITTWRGAALPILANLWGGQLARVHAGEQYVLSPSIPSTMQLLEQQKQQSDAEASEMTDALPTSTAATNEPESGKGSKDQMSARARRIKRRTLPGKASRVGGSRVGK